ncbi:hypothetical protein CP8484711_2285A, partial [Chlamydia psittaci 84-8471/1]
MNDKDITKPSIEPKKGPVHGVVTNVANTPL